MYMEGCTAPKFETATLHSAVVELVAMKGAKNSVRDRPRKTEFLEYCSPRSGASGRNVYQTSSPNGHRPREKSPP